MSGWVRSLLRNALSEVRGLGTILGLAVAGVGIAALGPWPLKLIVDQVLRGEPLSDRFSWLRPLFNQPSASVLLLLVGATIMIFVAGQLVKLCQAYIHRGVGERMMYRLAGDLFNHSQRLSLRYHESQRTGDLMRRITADVECVRDLTFGVVVPALTASVTLIVFFGVMWNLSSQMTVIALLAALPLPVLIRWLGPRMSEAAYAYQTAEGQLMAQAEQTLSAMPIVQAFDRGPVEVSNFHAATDRALSAYLRSISAQLRFKVAAGTPTAMGTALMLVIGGLKVTEGDLTVGTLLIFLTYLASLYGPVETLAELGSSFANASARARRVFELLDSAEVIPEGSASLVMRSERAGGVGDVRFEAVTAGYERGRPVLEEVTFVARSGETVALVGPTGSGKSTLVSLLPRFLDPWQGRVTIGGQDVRELSLSSLRSHIGLVLQEAFLLPISVAANIAYGRPKASRADVIAAAEAANADEFIRQLPEGYDTVLGERGATLSGGQSQRVAIARALLKDAPILILDEPTSALDANTEASLLVALERLMRGRTTFIIAHRLSTIRHADNIIVLDRGRVTGRMTARS
jgi:ATP-binding cassette subfamily B protein/subfamily B ATP-binding cassette protein MsbA